MVTMDGKQYRVRVKLQSLTRSFRIEDSEHSAMVKSGEMKRDIIGTYYDYTMEVEPDPAALEDYDAFFEVISAPVESHSITVPYAQGTMTYDAMVYSGRDTKKGRLGGINRWGTMEIQFKAKKPQRRPV